MQEVWEELGSAKFWLLVVIAGLLINVISHYLRSAIEAWLSKISKSYKAKLSKSKAAKQKHYKGLVLSTKKRSYQYSESLLRILISSLLMIICVVTVSAIIQQVKFHNALYIMFPSEPSLKILFPINQVPFLISITIIMVIGIFLSGGLFVNAYLRYIEAQNATLDAIELDSIVEELT